MVRKVILYEANTLYFIPGDRENFSHTDGDVNPKSMLVVQGGGVWWCRGGASFLRFEVSQKIAPRALDIHTMMPIRFL